MTDSYVTDNNIDDVFYDLLVKYEILLGAQGWSDEEIQKELQNYITKYQEKNSNDINK